MNKELLHNLLKTHMDMPYPSFSSNNNKYLDDIIEDLFETDPYYVGIVQSILGRDYSLKNSINYSHLSDLSLRVQDASEKYTEDIDIIKIKEIRNCLTSLENMMKEIKI